MIYPMAARHATYVMVEPKGPTLYCELFSQHPWQHANYGHKKLANSDMMEKCLIHIHTYF